MKHKSLIITILLFSLPALAQQKTSFSLREATDYALKHNVGVRKADNEVLKAKKKVWETTAMGFPNISAQSTYQKFLKQPVNLLPARIFNPHAPADQYIPVKFGTEQSMKWGLQWNQLIFSGSYITGLYSSRTYKKISELAAVKTRQKIREAVTRAYANALLTDESLQILQNNIDVVENNLFEVRQMYKNGLVEETDVEQLEITLAQLKNQKDYMQRLHDTAYEMLNYVMGRNPDDALVLTDDLESLYKQAADLKLLQARLKPENNIDYKMAKNKVKAGKLQVRFQQSQFLPTIAGFVTYGKNAYNNDFKFFDKDQNWYEQSVLGISINIPVFNGFVKHKKVGQARLDYENAKMDFENTQRKLAIDFKRLQNEYEHSLNEVNTARQNWELARKIERKEQIKFKEGVGNSFQLAQARMQLYAMQQNYLKALTDVLTKKTELENFLGVNQETNKSNQQ